MKSMRSMKKILGLSIFYALALQSVPLAAMDVQRRPKPNRMEGKRGINRPLNKNKQNNKNKKRIPGPVNGKKNQKLNSNESRQTRSIAGRSDGFMSFAKKVEAYAAKAKSEYGRTDNGSKPLLDVFHKMRETGSLKEVKKIIEPIKDLIEKQAPDGKSLKVQEEVGAALLLKASLPLGEQARSIICEMLHKLDNYISYWHEQKHHPAHYFFHKNPKKWMVGSKQKHEINANLDVLDVVRKDHLRLLSKLVEHESYFDQSAALCEQYEWLAKYLSMISNICYNTQAKLDGIAQDKSARFEKLLTLVYDMLGRVSYHESNVARALGGAKKPGHITRNWIGYSALALGTCAFAWYARKNQERFYNWFNVDVKQGAAYAWNTASEKVSNLYDAVIGKDNEPGADVDFNQLRHDLNGRLAQMRDDLRGIRDNLHHAQQDLQQNRPQNPIGQPEAIAQCQSAVRGYRETRAQLVHSGILPQAPAQNIDDVNFADLKPTIQRILNQAFEDIAHLNARVNAPPVNPQPVQLGGVVSVGIGNQASQWANNFINGDIAAYRANIPGILAMFGHVTNLGNVYLLLYQMDGISMVNVGADVVGNLSNLIGTVSDMVDPLSNVLVQGINLEETAQQIVTQQKVTLGVLSLFPVGLALAGTFWGANKLYKAFKFTPNFKPIREALLEIAHLLNEEGLPKKTDDAQLDQGKILYMVWKLKREANNVPALQREQFLTDINRLGRSDLDHGKRIWTSDKKLRIIDLMYRTYDFLNPAYVAQ